MALKCYFKLKVDVTTNKQFGDHLALHACFRYFLLLNVDKEYQVLLRASIC